MGWDGEYISDSSKATINKMVENRWTTNGANPDVSFKVEKVSHKGAVHYLLVSCLNNKTGETKKHIVVVLHKIIGRRRYLHNKEIMFKDMDAASEPYNYDCPLKWLDEADLSDPRAQAWAEKVRAHYAAKKTKVPIKQKFVVGDRWYVRDPKGVSFGSAGRIRGFVVAMVPKKGLPRFTSPKYSGSRYLLFRREIIKEWDELMVKDTPEALLSL
jgi:hypothetical protein